MSGPMFKENDTHHPDWAPHNMVRLAKEQIDSYLYEANKHSPRLMASYTRKAREAEIAELAATDPRMEKVWKSYRARFFKKREIDENDQKWAFLQQEMAQLLRYITRERTPWDRTPIGEKTNTLNKTLKVIEGLEQSLEMGLWALEGFSEELSRMHEAVCKEIRELQEPKSIIQPGAKGVEVTSFIRAFCFWHKHYFGLPLYENTAILADVYLDIQVDVQAVVDSFRPVKNMENFFDKEIE
jgi:hypothetical protein